MINLFFSERPRSLVEGSVLNSGSPLTALTSPSAQPGVCGQWAWPALGSVPTSCPEECFECQAAELSRRQQEDEGS